MARWVLLAAIVAALVAGVVWRHEVVAQARAATVLGTVIDIPVLSPVVRGVTDEPRIRESTLAGQQATIVMPAGGGGPWPGLLFITGADGEGRGNEQLLDAARGLARAGYVAVLPDLPGLREGVVTVDAVDAAAMVVAEAAQLPEVEGDRIAVGSVSVGASIALLVADTPQLEEKVSVVAAIAPYASVRNVLQSVTTGTYRMPDGSLVERRQEDWLRRALVRSMLALVAEQPGVPRDAVDELAAQTERADDPLDPLRALPLDQVPREARPLLELMANRDPMRFDELYEALQPDVRQQLEQLSPVNAVSEVDVPVEIVAPPDDPYFPLPEQRALADAAPQGRLTVTRALEHGQPGDEPWRQPMELAKLDWWLVRVLVHAAAPPGG